MKEVNIARWPCKRNPVEDEAYLINLEDILS